MNNIYSSLNNYQNMNELWTAYCKHIREEYSLKCAKYGAGSTLARPSLIDGNWWLEVGLSISHLVSTHKWSPKFYLFMIFKGYKGATDSEEYKNGLNQLEEILFNKGLLNERMYYE